MPTGSAPEGMYMVTSGTHVNSGCCFDYGNSETTRRADGAGAMDAIYFGTSCWFGGCSGTGPWVQADLEYGPVLRRQPVLEPEPAGLHQQVRHRDAEEQRHLTLRHQGQQRPVRQPDHPVGRRAAARLQPDEEAGRHHPGQRRRLLQPDGGTNHSAGTFYEGAMVAGYPSDATENAVQANIVAAGYR